MTVEQYKEIIEVAGMQLTPLKHNIELVSIFLDVDKTTVGRMKAREVMQDIQNMQDEMKAYTVGLTVNMEDETLERMNFQEITLGEFIDLEHYLTHGELDKLLAVLYRKKFNGGMVKHTYEPYNQVDIDYRSLRFLKMPADQLAKNWQEYLNYRNGLIAVYQSLFEENEEDMLEEEDVMTAAERKKMEMQKNHGAFAWESLILFLCCDDITKWENVCDLPVILAFNITSYQKAAKKN